MSLNAWPVGRLIITLLRAALALVTGLSAGYFTFWIGAAIFGSVNLPYWLAIPLAIVTALFVGRFVWKRTTPHGLAQSMLVGALIIGGIAFLAGFFGPLILMPESNQGPLLGLFFTGPLGFLVGGVAGAVYWFAKGRRTPNTAA